LQLNVNIRLTLLVAALFILLLPVSRAAARANEHPFAQETLAVDKAVTVSVCVEVGDVTVRGWERAEVQARSADAGKIELRRTDGTSAPTDSAASRIEVLAGNRNAAGLPGASRCHQAGSIELSVPHGSIVQIRAPSGQVSVEAVAGVRAETVGGEIELSGITKSAEAFSGSGAISLLHSTGSVSLRTISGEIMLSDVGPSAAEDAVGIKTTSGEVTLENVRHARVSAATSHGGINFDGPLAPGGIYDLKTHSGDIVLMLSPAAAFQLNAKVYQRGAVETEFPIRQLPGTTLVLKDGRFTGLHGEASAQTAALNLTSFNGTLELRKK